MHSAGGNDLSQVDFCDATLIKSSVAISLGSSPQDFRFKARILGQHIDVRRAGTDGSAAEAARPRTVPYGGRHDACRSGLHSDKAIDDELPAMK